jgi:hypothetical protein
MSSEKNYHALFPHKGFIGAAVDVESMVNNEWEVDFNGFKTTKGME